MTKIQKCDGLVDLGTERAESTLPRFALRDREAAESIGISRARFWQLVRAGEIPVVRLPGRTTRFTPEDLAAFVRKYRESSDED